MKACNAEMKCAARRKWFQENEHYGNIRYQYHHHHVISSSFFWFGNAASLASQIDTRERDPILPRADRGVFLTAQQHTSLPSSLLLSVRRPLKPPVSLLCLVEEHTAWDDEIHRHWAMEKLTMVWFTQFARQSHIPVR